MSKRQKRLNAKLARLRKALRRIDEEAAAFYETDLGQLSGCLGFCGQCKPFVQECPLGVRWRATLDRLAEELRQQGRAWIGHLY